MNSPGPLTLAGWLLRRGTLRHWIAAPWQTAAQVLILALGIAVFFSIRLANRAALGSFQNFTGLLTQSSDWQISAPAGKLPTSVLGELRTSLADQPVELVPVLETTAAALRPPGSPEFKLGDRPLFRLLGLDLVAVQNLASAHAGDREWFDQSAATLTNRANNTSLWGLIGRTNAVFISPAHAQTTGLKVGDHFRLVVNENVVEFTVAGLIPTNPARPQPPENLLVMDLPALQALTHRENQIDRVEFVVPDGPNVALRREALRARVAALGQGRWRVLTSADRQTGAAMMTRAFRMNLTILSLIGLLVGLYLIFQSLDGAVVRRREEIGVLRSLGIPEGAIWRAWLLEAALLGLLGGLVGALLGWVGAQFAVRFVGRTVNALYYSTTVNSARLSGTELLAALGLALGASLIAGWWPARQAARTPPAQILSRLGEGPERPTWFQSPRLAAALFLAAGALVQLPPLRFAGALRFPLGGYTAALCLIVGGGIACSLGLQWLARWLRPLGHHSLAAKLAISHLARASSRHRLAASALLCAVTMAAGMIILVASFETTMRDWIARTFQADLYISSDGAQSASTENRIAPETWQALLQNPAVADANLMQSQPVEINGLSTMLVGVDLGFTQRHPTLSWRQKPSSDAIYDVTRNDSLALASESFCERFRLRRGDPVTVPTPAGPRSLTIAGTFSDYGNERGSLVVERRHFAAWFGDELVTSLIVYTRPNADPDQVQAALSVRYPGLSILTNRHLRTEILRIFRQTFSVTYALELIGIVVAVIGLGMTLWSILLDRRAELTTLRALGWRPAEMAWATAVEGALLGAGSVAVGLLISLGLGWILVYVINKQSFGWTLEFAVPWMDLTCLGVLVVSTGTFVSWLMGRRGSRLAADREE